MGKISRYAKIACLALLGVFLFFHCFLFAARFLYQSGVNRMHDEQWDKAIATFDRAEAVLPFFIPKVYTLQDRFRIYCKKGEALNEKALASLKEKGVTIWALTTYRQSRQVLEKAVAINPDVYVPAYWQARTENSLELLYPKLFPGKENPYNADPFYQNAIRLWPNGITVHYSYARYLAAVGSQEKLAQTVTRMTEIYPASYNYLKQEPFFTYDLMLNMEKGLDKALADDTNPREALQALADIYSEKGDSEEAVKAYEKSLTIRSFANNTRTFIRMGELLLKDGQPDQSAQWFFKALKTAEDFEKTLTSVFHIHRREAQLEAFIKLAMDYEKHSTVESALDIAIAKAWMDLDNTGMAKVRLVKLNEQKENAEACYLLAKIAETEKDLDQMELFSQRATVLDKENADYEHLFSKTLYYQKKYDSAEKAATQAIEKLDKPNSWYFSHRAWCWWHLKKYGKAIADWKRAFDIKPDYANYLFWIARAFEKEGMIKDSRLYIEKALAMDPEKPEYIKFKETIEQKKN